MVERRLGSAAGGDLLDEGRAERHGGGPQVTLNLVLPFSFVAPMNENVPSLHNGRFFFIVARYVERCCQMFFIETWECV